MRSPPFSENKGDDANFEDTTMDRAEIPPLHQPFPQRFSFGNNVEFWLVPEGARLEPSTNSTSEAAIWSTDLRNFSGRLVVRSVQPEVPALRTETLSSIARYDDSDSNAAQRMDSSMRQLSQGSAKETTDETNSSSISSNQRIDHSVNNKQGADDTNGGNVDNNGDLGQSNKRTRNILHSTASNLFPKQKENISGPVFENQSLSKNEEENSLHPVVHQKSIETTWTGTTSLKGKEPSDNFGLSKSEIFHVYGVRKSIPAIIRERRLEARLSSLSSLDGGNYDQQSTVVTSNLHLLCANSSATLAEMVQCLEEDPQAAFVKDAIGRLPLHVLGDNEERHGTSFGKQITSSFAMTLLQANPEAITSVDNRGYIPFVSLIAEWVEWIFQNNQRHHETQRKTVFPSWISLGNYGPSTDASPPKSPESSVSTISKVFPMKPELWDEVEFCFVMLSMFMDELAGKSGNLIAPNKRDEFAESHSSSSSLVLKRQDKVRREIATHLISAVPGLMKCLLLIETEGGATRNRVFQLPIIRRMLLCKESIGDWLASMLRQQGVPGRSAVDFLEMISVTGVEDFTGGFRATTFNDDRQFHRERDGVFDAINELEGTMASLVTMENRETERAASTKVVWFIMAARLERPFSLGLVLIDLVLHITLMLAFRNNVQMSDSRYGKRKQ